MPAFSPFKKRQIRVSHVWADVSHEILCRYEVQNTQNLPNNAWNANNTMF